MEIYCIKLGEVGLRIPKFSFEYMEVDNSDGYKLSMERMLGTPS